MVVRRNLPRCPLSNSHLWSAPGGERRQQSNGRQDHRNQEHEGQCVCHALNIRWFTVHPTVAVMPTMDNILPCRSMMLPGWPTSGAGEDLESLGRAGHGDIAVDRSFDAVAECLWIDEDDQVELEPLR
jgi:hypothetical protein